MKTKNKSIVEVQLTKAELNYILSLIYTNEEDGWYYGNFKQFWERSLKLKQKLLLLEDEFNNKRGEK